MDLDSVEDSPTADEYLEHAFELEEEDKVDEALVECEAAIEMGRSFLADAYNLRGIILEGQGQSEEALAAYRMALEFDPDLEDARLNLNELEAEMGINHEPVTVARFGSIGEAYLARGLLQAEGIESFVADEYALATLGLSATLGIRLQVEASDVDRALEILGKASDEEEIEPDEEMEPDDEVACPQCGSWDVRPPLLGKEWRCKDCDYRWTL
jgi:tetratricopeptide (TPR) repeat protein